MSIDRRRFPRKPLAENVFGYLEGNRIDIRTQNVSAGGMFVETNNVDGMPDGARLGVVFDDDTALTHRIFLFGLVVRRQTGTVEGVGVKWEKAVTSATPEVLARFLADKLGLPYAAVLERTVEDGEQERCSYVFDDQEGNITEESAPHTGPDLKLVLDKALDRIDVNRAEPTRHVDRRALLHSYDPEPVSRPFPKAGPMTQQVNVDGIRAVSKLSTKLHIRDKRVKGTVIALGVRSLLLETDGPVPIVQEEIEIPLDIPFKDGSAPVVCMGTVVGVEPGPAAGRLRLEYEFKQSREGSFPGVLKAYVRWLHLQAMRNNH